MPYAWLPLARSSFNYSDLSTVFSSRFIYLLARSREIPYAASLSGYPLDTQEMRSFHYDYNGIGINVTVLRQGPVTGVLTHHNAA